MAIMFARVRLSNWRNFTEVDFTMQNRVFLIGPNASGKSNLLDVFRFLRELSMEGGGLQPAIKRRGGLASIRSLAARSDTKVSISVTMDLDGEEWSYLIEMDSDRKGEVRITKEEVMHGEETLVDRPSVEDRKDAKRLTQCTLQQVNENFRMRAMVEFFQSVDYVHIVPQIVREPDRFPGLVDDPYGADFLERMASTNANTRKARLRKMVQALQLAVPQLESLEVARDEKGRPHLKGKYRNWRSKGAWQAESTFSDGTLRLIGLLWALQDGKGPLLLEEPELSLHPYIVRNIPRIFIKAQQRSPRQVILSTHSPEMLGDEGIGLDEVLVLTPEKEGIRVGKASDIEQITLLMQGGMRLADAILPYTAPRDSGQLTMLDF